MLGLYSDRKTVKRIDTVSNLNKFLDSHIKINADDEQEYIKAKKLIKIVNSILEQYDTSLLYNKKSFEKTKAYMIKDLVKSKSLKLTKDLITNYVDNRLTGSRAYSLRKKL